MSFQALKNALKNAFLDQRSKTTDPEAAVDDLSQKMATAIDNFVDDNGGGTSTVYWNDILSKPTQFPPTAHSHAISEITNLSTELATKELIANKVIDIFIDPNNTTYPTTLAVKQAIDEAVTSIINGAPNALDTLLELSEALGNDPDFAANIINELATKVDKVTGKGLSTEDFTTAEKTKLQNTILTSVLTQAAYDALTPKDADTLYIII
jgi:hypothetical protein